LETLVQLQRRKRLHETEFVALARSMVYAYVGKREFSRARRWLTMLEDYDPEHPVVDELEQYIQFKRGSPKMLSRLFRLFRCDFGD